MASFTIDGIACGKHHLLPVTGAARLAVIHIPHRYRFAVHTGRHYFVMTVAAAIPPPHVYLMTEGDRLDIFLDREVITYRLE